MSYYDEKGKMSCLNKIDRQINYWSESSTRKTKTFITISRQYGSEGWYLAKRIEEKLNLADKYDPPWFSFDKEMLAMIMDDKQLEKKFDQSLQDLSEEVIDHFFGNRIKIKKSDMAIFKKISGTIRKLAYNGHVIIVGRGGTFITQHLDYGFRVRVIAPFKMRVKNIAERENISLKESENLIKKIENERASFVKDHFCVNISDPLYYSLIINMAHFDLESASEVVINAMKARSLI